MLRQQTKPTSRIHGIIVDGGEKPNIIPERSEMEYYVRGSRDEDVIHLMEKLITCAKGAASATGKLLFHWINALEYMFENEGLRFTRVLRKNWCSTNKPEAGSTSSCS